MKILIINSAEPKERGFVDPIVQALDGIDLEINICEWRKNSDDLDSYDAIIISASPRGDNANFKDRIKAFNWLRTITKPVLGICAGQQFIGFIFGSDLIKNQEIEDGFFTVQIKADNPLFKGCKHEFEVEQHHNDSITLPDRFELLASSSKCKVQAICHKNKPIFSVQWHTERSNPEIIRNFVDIAKEISEVS